MFDIQFILLGFIQGITEFLPISSSAHLVITSEIFNWNDQGINFDVAVHFGTLLAVVFYLRKIIYNILVDVKFHITTNKSKQNFLYLKIIISTLPAILTGFFIYNNIIVFLRNVELIAYSCILFGIILYLVDRNSKFKKNWDTLSFKEAIIIGIFQCFAFIPGASRAGVTITASRLLGFSRESSAIYSFILSIPIIFSSSVLVSIEYYSQATSTLELSKIIVPALVSFFTALLSIKFMILLVKKTSYNFFVIYRILLGIVLLTWIYI
ncbi:MAG: undecaprenyl-diphosphatase [Pelagibacteraceae bacterium]|nr:undecaprenyl-diphosphatase [Pelagibacteraceae bacterium]PPR51549.1 MAG: Undecaprenyl-diphosphatase [Alphaproteobacteria bacterium MarineAlpha5_Bin10]|tara:strand:+ start:9099 stop:9899 length:801 start_codon:yes stop_codon:yes gene_type:complete